MITEDYVSFEIAKLLKENGYNGDFNGYYNSAGILISIPNAVLEQHGYVFYYRPSIALAMKWLRKVYNIFIEISVDEMIEGYQWSIYYNDTKEIRPYCGVENTYEQTCESAIKYCLENLI